MISCKIHPSHLSDRRRQFAGGVIAVVGGDGSGKTTAVRHLLACLANHFETDYAHLGKPPWSWTTRFVRSIIKLCRALRLYDEDRLVVDVAEANSTSVYPVLLRAVCKARDRHRAYRKACRLARRGRLVICDRFPVAEITLMDAPNAERIMRGRPANRLTRLLTELEKSYYRRIDQPDLLFVLRLDPDIAVRRKLEENPRAVRIRNEEIWRRDWDTSPAYVIDAGQPQSEVLASIERIVCQEM